MPEPMTTFALLPQAAPLGELALPFANALELLREAAGLGLEVFDRAPGLAPRQRAPQPAPRQPVPAWPAPAP